MKEFDVRVQSLIYQITTLSKLEAEKAEKKLLYDYLAAVMQELPEEPKARAHMLDAMERTVKDLEQRKNGEAGLNIGGSLLGTIPPGGGALCGNSLPDTYARPTKKTDYRNGINAILGRSQKTREP